MKKLFVILAIILMAAMSAPVLADPPLTFLWNANTEPDLVGYRIYFSETSGDYVFGGNTSPNFLAEIPCGPNNSACCYYNKPAIPGFYYYVAIAFDADGFESAPSDELNTLPPGKVKNFIFQK